MIGMAILLVTIHSGPLEGESFVIPYNTLESCMAAIKPISNTLDYDHSLLCTPLGEGEGESHE